MQAWILLISAIFFEVLGTIAMKYSDGFTKWLPTLLLFIFYVISLSLLTLTLRHIDVGTAYAVWSGLGTFLIAMAGIFLFKDVMSVTKAMGMFSIILGVVLLNISGTSH